MLRSSPKVRSRTRLRFAVLAGLLVGLVLGCVHPAATGETDSAAAPQDSSTGPSLDPAISSEVKKRPHEPIASVLESRFAGVSVAVNSDGSIVVRIRGASSFFAGSDPLYVLDGTPMPPGPRGALFGVNPHDIESIQVLKYPPATSLYGVRGANGVVLITTKRPGRSGNS